MKTNKDHYFETSEGTLPDEVRKLAEELDVPYEENVGDANVVKFPSSDNYREFKNERIENGLKVVQVLGQEFHNWGQVRRRLTPVATDGGELEEVHENYSEGEDTEYGEMSDVSHESPYGTVGTQNSFDRGTNW